MVFKQNFYDWCIENSREDLIDRWDFDLNLVSPEEVSSCSTKYFYFKCPERIHKSSSYKIVNITRKNPESTKVSCIYCNSFANYAIKNIDENFFKKVLGL